MRTDQKEIGAKVKGHPSTSQTSNTPTIKINNDNNIITTEKTGTANLY